MRGRRGAGLSSHCLRAHGQAFASRLALRSMGRRACRRGRGSAPRTRRRHFWGWFIFWQTWHGQSFAEGLVQSGERPAAKGIAKAAPRARLCGGGGIERDRAMLKANFQREAAEFNLPHFLAS
eukprot:2510024-Pyramimonas_sp.AAC.1